MDAHSWLQSGQDYSVGLDILRAEKHNPALLSILSSGPTFYNRKRLLQELTALAALKPKAPEVQGKRRLPRFEYPEELHPAFDRQDALYREINLLHPQLDLLYASNVGECHKAAQAIVAAGREIDEIYRILDYWEQNSVILPNAYRITPEQFVPIDYKDLRRKRDRLYKFIQRNKEKPSRHVEVEKARQDLQEINQQMANA